MLKFTAGKLGGALFYFTFAPFLVWTWIPVVNGFLFLASAQVLLEIATGSRTGENASKWGPKALEYFAFSLVGLAVAYLISGVLVSGIKNKTVRVLSFSLFWWAMYSAALLWQGGVQFGI